MKRVKASEISLAKSTAAAISRRLAPIEAWKQIEAPRPYLESRTGLYISGLEEVLKVASEEGDLHLVRQLCLDLLHLTDIGKAKAEITLAGVNKLRSESDFSKVDTSKLLELLGKVAA